MIKPTKSQQAILDALHAHAMGISLSNVVLDLDAFPSETSYYLRDCNSSAHACICHSPGVVTYCVEYFGHDDCVIHTLKCVDVETMLQSLKWLQACLADIRKRLDNLF